MSEPESSRRESVKYQIRQSTEEGSAGPRAWTGRFESPTVAAAFVADNPDVFTHPFTITEVVKVTTVEERIVEVVERVA